jgi:hypothetical protein
VVSALRPLGPRLEFFPIPSTVAGEPEAIGISVPAAAADETGWRELEKALTLLLGQFQMEITELNSGQRVAHSNLGKVRRRLLGASTWRH